MQSAYSKAHYCRSAIVISVCVAFVYFHFRQRPLGAIAAPFIRDASSQPRPSSITSFANSGGKDDYELANSQSFNFFNDIPTAHWNRLHQIYARHQNHRYPDKPFTTHPDASQSEYDAEIWGKSKVWKDVFRSIPAWYQNNYEPNFSCQFEKRVGIPMNGDGPKWVCDPHRITRLATQRKESNPNHPGCVVYSVGSNGDFTFELGMQSEVGVNVCEYHIFDMGNYGNKVPKELKRAYYHQWGLMRQGGKAPPSLGRMMKMGEKHVFKGLKDTIKELGHEALDVIDIFKIDCEGCEWETYRDWIANDIPMLHQLLVEVHQAPMDKVLDFFDSLDAAGYLRYHKEPNIQFGPNCLEYGFVKVDKSFTGKEIDKKLLGKN